MSKNIKYLPKNKCVNKANKSPKMIKYDVIFRSNENDKNNNKNET